MRQRAREWRCRCRSLGSIAPALAGVAAVCLPDREKTVADQLIVRGAREHNLKDIHVELPRDALIVFTGLSGSGKSSLAFDTIFAEGQRRYVESLSAYARQFLGQMDKPDVDFIEGLSPAVSIDQKSTSRNPRSTVGTITEVYDYLRLLFARIGRPHCPDLRGTDHQADPAADRRPHSRDARRHPVPDPGPGDPGAKRRVRRPVQRLADQGVLAGSGWTASCTAHRPAAAEEAGEAHDRGGCRPADGQDDAASSASPTRSRRHWAWPAAWSILDFVDLPDDDPHRERRYSERLACPNNHPLAIDELEPRSFSFNSPFGACPVCTGLGTRQGGRSRARRPRSGGHPGRRGDRARGPAARRASTSCGCCKAWPTPKASTWTRRGSDSRPERRRPSCTAWTSRCMSGTGTATAAIARTTPATRGSSRGSSAGTPRPIATTPARSTRATCGEVPCPACQGTRLKPEILAVTIADRSIAERGGAVDRRGGRLSPARPRSPSASGSSPSGC